MPAIPQRLQRSRRRGTPTPAEAIYVGRPTIWGNPFAGRSRIGHARSVILYRAWIAGQLSIHVLRCAGFGEDEMTSLRRWRERLLSALPSLRGRDLQCWCPLSSEWCHADVLIRAANEQRVSA